MRGFFMQSNIDEEIDDINDLWQLNTDFVKHLDN